MFLSLPVTLLSLLSALLPPTYAQQCRLVRQDLVPSPDNPFPTSAPGSGNVTTGSGSGSGTGTGNSSSTNGTATLQPFKYGQQPVRGVNIGGWLVLQPWITPSFFNATNNTDVVDEYTLGQLVDRDTALQMLQNHWETWITEQDFKDIAAAGLNHVRIPIGYWSVPITPADTNYTTSVDPYIPGAWPYLLKALNWAKSAGLHVVLDLHGAPGSQNGFDNSGQRTSTPVWGANPANVSRTLDIVTFMVKEVGGLVDVIELLNEPAGFQGGGWPAAIRGYWQDGYDAVRKAVGSGIRVMIEDAFLGINQWEGFLTAPDAQGVIMDTHQYQVFNTDQLGYSPDEHINFTCTLKSGYSAYVDDNIWMVMGEWTTAVTDCATWLNGRGVGARWDGSMDVGQTFGSCAGYTGDQGGWSDSYKTFLRRYWEAQVAVAEAASGWIYWCWKTESADDWSYQKGLEGGWIPQDPSDRLYPDICG
ncbi:glycoside hydrolase [Gloeophyllum trabeum ATCC 11539]|uniref:Glycoside hydrolase n=1 Tax=Gloeophyllum trabeum (strain ATCC 11539 / FP-39264 / Madison 617) TaxID=670483 RepID=S7Q3G4_GLOTA|nr:glycoside hydrolase [Gloeophyllum trabeum ATCC 11539]EPQ54092.1 glycoside hydrolase [Gloeophyllum trabeum ATCC 11539]